MSSPGKTRLYRTERTSRERSGLRIRRHAGAWCSARRRTGTRISSRSRSAMTALCPPSRPRSGSAVLVLQAVSRRERVDALGLGPNKLAIMTEPDVRVAYPYFFSPEVGRFSTLVGSRRKSSAATTSSAAIRRPRVTENTLSEFPVVYMQDGKNLFFPEEAFLGQDWGVDKARTFSTR